MIASSLIAEGMNWWQSVLTIFLGNAIVLVPMILTSVPGAMPAPMAPKCASNAPTATGIPSRKPVRAAHSAVSADDLRAHCAERLADYKVPRRIEFADELPRNATGKILKDKLRQSLV